MGSIYQVDNRVVDNIDLNKEGEVEKGGGGII